MRSGQFFCNLEKYVCANFQVKWSENGGIVATFKVIFSKKGQIYSVLTRILKKISSKFKIPKIGKIANFAGFYAMNSAKNKKFKKSAQVKFYDY